MNKDIHTTNIVGAWVEVGEGYSLKRDTEANLKLFWARTCLWPAVRPFGGGEFGEPLPCWSSKDSFYTEDDLRYNPQVENYKIKAWAYITGPEFKKETPNNGQ